MKKCYGVDIDKQRDALLESDTARRIYQPIIDKADSALNKVYPALRMTEYMMFDQTGDRVTFERGYFERRNDLSYLLCAFWLTEDDKYKNAVIDLVCMISDEFTWCLPAHIHNDKWSSGYLSCAEIIDLFASETARLLSDVCDVVGDKLPDFITTRIRYEVDRRIIKPLFKHKYWWQRCTNNWASVCAAGCARAVLRFASEDEKKALIPTFEGCMEHFLSGYKDDGCCPEGFSYWCYGFGYFVIYAQQMLEYSNGEVNYFDSEKVKNIALFPQKARMGKGRTVCFSDGVSDFKIGSGIICYLRGIYGEVIQRPDIEFLSHKGNVYSVSELLWFDPDYREDPATEAVAVFEKTQWVISRRDKYSFAAKGGHNYEPHNHNDVGSFMIVASGDDIPLAELGSEQYRKETFAIETRYTLINHCSWGHSLPIINGDGYQIYGEEYAAKNVSFENDVFSLDIEGAYEAGIVDGIHREFKLLESSVTLCDTYKFSDRTEFVTERFVSLTKPEICEGYVDLGSARICFDADRYSVSYTTGSYIHHALRAETTVYLIDVVGKDKEEKSFEFEIEIM